MFSIGSVLCSSKVHKKTKVNRQARCGHHRVPLHPIPLRSRRSFRRRASSVAGAGCRWWKKESNALVRSVDTVCDCGSLHTCGHSRPSIRPYRYDRSNGSGMASIQNGRFQLELLRMPTTRYIGLCREVSCLISVTNVLCAYRYTVLQFYTAPFTLCKT